MNKFRSRTPHQRACWMLLLFLSLMLGLSFLIQHFWAPTGGLVYLQVALAESVPIILAAVVYGLMRRPDTVSFYRLRSISASTFFFMLLFGLCANGFGIFVNLPVSMLTNLLGQVPQSEALFPTSPAEYAFALLSVALLPALFEEILCRGIVLREYEAYGTHTAIIASALCFAVIHNTFYNLPFTFFFGVVLAVVTIQTGSTIPAMLMHFANNAASLSLGYALGSIPLLKTDAMFSFLLLGIYVLLAFGFVLLLSHFSRHPGSFAAEGSTPRPMYAELSKSATAQARPRFGFSVALVVLLVIFILMQVSLVMNMTAGISGL